MKFIKHIIFIIKSYSILYTSGWHTLYFTPPNQRVKVKDQHGSVGYAHPTYYPFEIKQLKGDENKQWGWRGTPIFYGNGIHKWDGGWLIECHNLTSNIDTIIKWKKL